MKRSRKHVGNDPNSFVAGVLVEAGKCVYNNSGTQRLQFESHKLENLKKM